MRIHFEGYSTVITGVRPTWVRARAWEAAHGEVRSYRALASSLPQLIADGLLGWSDEDDVYDPGESAFAVLVDLIEAEDAGEIVRWLRLHAPRVMELVPARRHVRVAEGLIEQEQVESIEDALELDLSEVPRELWPPRLTSTDDPDAAIRKLVRHFRTERNRQWRALRERCPVSATGIA